MNCKQLDLFLLKVKEEVQRCGVCLSAIENFLQGFIDATQCESNADENITIEPEENCADEMLAHTYLNDMPVSVSTLDAMYDLALQNQIKLSCTINNGKINYKTM